MKRVVIARRGGSVVAVVVAVTVAVGTARGHFRFCQVQQLTGGAGACACSAAVRLFAASCAE